MSDTPNILGTAVNYIELPATAVIDLVAFFKDIAQEILSYHDLIKLNFKYNYINQISNTPTQ